MKRTINEELADVWGVMINERIEKLREKCSIEQKRDIDNYIDGMIAAVALFNCLEKGRFIRDYERIKRTLDSEEGGE